MLVQTVGWFGPDEVEIPDDGALTPEARHAFTNGQCHAFALAVQELTGWQIGGISWSYYEGQEVPNHVVARSPDGRLIDITGDVDTDRWGTDFRPFDPDAFDAWILGTEEEPEGYLVPNVEAARPFAQNLLTTLDYL